MSNENRTWTEEIEVAGTQLVDRVKELVQEGNVRSVIIRKPDGQRLLVVPLTAGVAVGSVVTLFAPVLAALGALAALLTNVKIEVVRSETKAEESISETPVADATVSPVAESDAEAVSNETKKLDEVFTLDEDVDLND